MKKRICLLIMIVFIGTIICGCTFTNPPELTGYSNICEEDRAITRMVAARYDYSLTNYDPIVPPNFVQKIDSIKSETYSFYTASIDIDSCYYICGYGNSVLSTAMYMTFGDGDWLYEWYRVDGLENVQRTINGKELLHILAVYDATIDRDIVSGTEYRYKAKYYNKQDTKEPRPIFPASDAYILYLKSNLVNEADSIYISSFELNNGYKMHTDINGVQYLSFIHEKQRETDSESKNYSKNLFLEYYDVLSPHFVLIDELENHYEYEGYDITERYAGIELEYLVDLLIK